MPGSEAPPEPTSDYGRWTKTQGDIPPEETPGSGWPGAVPIRPSNWNMDTDPDSYQIAWGDTFAGLSATYLGTPLRWREIWNQQPDTYRYSRSPDRIMPGEWIFMPPDASATLRAALGQAPTNRALLDLAVLAAFTVVLFALNARTLASKVG